MKQRNVNLAPEIMRPSISSGQPPSDIKPSPDRLQQAKTELMEFKLALAASQQ